MSTITTLAEGQLAATDSITIELVEAHETPAVVIITWPAKPTVFHPRRFPSGANTAAGVFAAAVGQVGIDQKGATTVTAPRREGARKPGPKPSDAMVDALCNECGDVRTAKAIYFSRTADCRPLKCEGACGRATKHYRAPTSGFESDWRESINADRSR